MKHYITIIRQRASVLLYFNMTQSYMYFYILSLYPGVTLAYLGVLRLISYSLNFTFGIRNCEVFVIWASGKR